MDFCFYWGNFKKMQLIIMQEMGIKSSSKLKIKFINAQKCHI